MRSHQGGLEKWIINNSTADVQWRKGVLYKLNYRLKLVWLGEYTIAEVASNEVNIISGHWMEMILTSSKVCP